MMNRLQTAAAKMIARLRAWPRRRYDVYVIGYPKVGNTWFQFMLRRALVLYYHLPEEQMWNILGDEGPVPKGVPSILVTHHMPRLTTESYREMVIDTRAVAGRKLILLIRDARDTLVSLYMDNRYRHLPPFFEGTLEEMVHDEVHGIEKYLKFYNAWYAARDLPSAFLLVRYEDLKLDTRRVMREALSFIGMVDVSDELVSDVLEFGSFENMRRMEENQAAPLVALKKSPGSRPESFKTRKGVVGDYKNHFKPETIAAIDRQLERELPALFGYHHDAD